MSVVLAKKLPFVLFRVMEDLYAVHSEKVREIVTLPQVVRVPQMPPEVRGVMNLRGKIIPVIDFRIKLGRSSLKAELDGLLQLLREREEDHRKWLAELEACVRERRPFGLARDPHQCKFGLWYDQFKTTDPMLGMVLRDMDAPHKLIHATAAVVLQKAEQGDQGGALELIAARRKQEMASLVKLFEEARHLLLQNHREVGVVLQDREKRLAISVDLVEAVEDIPDQNIAPMPVKMAEQGEMIQWRVGKRNKTSQTILIPDENSMFPTLGLEGLLSS